MRPEFVNQMKQLRSRIFKRVKPKVLNSTFITGESLVELCEAYVKAINQGSIPCIESAWTYVCKNECQRAIQTVVSGFKDALNKAMSEATLSSEQLAQLNTELLNQA